MEELDLVVGGEGQAGVLLASDLEGELWLLAVEVVVRVGLGLGKVRVGLARGSE